jgi:hypothetical protein
MNSSYNIYRQLAGDTLVWVDRVNGLQQAQDCVVGLGETSPGNYVIFDVRERTVVWVWAGKPNSKHSFWALNQYLARMKASWCAFATEIISVVAQQEVRIWRQELPHKLLHTTEKQITTLAAEELVHPRNVR